MLWTQDRIKLSRLLAEGYELDAVSIPYDYGKDGKGEHIVYVIGDPQQMRWSATDNHESKKLMRALGEVTDYYKVVKGLVIADDLEQGRDPDAFGSESVYTPDTNMERVLARTWEFGVIGATYLPDAINAVWKQTKYERNN